MSTSLPSDAIGDIEGLPLAERADRYLALLEELRRRLEDADASGR